MPKPPYLDKKDAFKALDQFVFARDSKCAGRVPKDVNPADIPEYLEDTLTDEFKGPRCWRVFRILDCYDLEEGLDPLRPFLTRDESEPETYQRSVCYTAIRGAVARGRTREEPLEYYEYLLQHRQAPTDFEGILRCYAALRVGLTPTSPDETMRKEMDRLEQQAATNEQAEYRLNELDELTEQVLPETEEDLDTVEQIAVLSNANRRRQALVANYVGHNTELGSVGDLWVTRLLRREARQAEAEVIAALRALLADPNFQGVDKEHLEMMKKRALRAIDFFGGKLNAKELELIKPDGQSDHAPLSWD